MEWQAAILALQILVLAIVWVLFQKARADLSAQAASTPILGEVKALQRNVRQLLTEIDQTSEEASTRLEAQIREARMAVTLLEERLEQVRFAPILEVNAPPIIAVTTQRTATPVPFNTETGEKSGARTLQRKAPLTANSHSYPDRKQGIGVAMDNRGDDAEAVAPRSPRDHRHETVYRMADSGSTSADIACATRLTEGEVETVLGLRRLS